MKKFIITSLFVFSLNAIAQNSDYQTGKKFYDRKEYQKAFTYFLKAANSGYAHAQFKVGSMYNEGEGIKKDTNKAIEWYLKAANNGDVDASNNLAIIYAQNDNFSEAYKWFLKAAEQGLASSQCAVGDMYQRGDGVGKDMVQAIPWYRKCDIQRFTHSN